jgi:hypothetical protein
MKMLARILAVSFAIASTVWAANPIVSVGPSGPPNAQEPSRDACWSEPPDFEGQIGSSEIISEFDFESEIANDFQLEVDATITHARWWGGYFNNNGCGDVLVATTWNLEFFDTDGCVPGNLLSEYVIPDYAGETLVYCQSGFYPIFTYEGAVSVPATANTRYWFVAQAGNHDYPPQVGRLSTAATTGCATVIRSVSFSWSDWYCCIFFDSSQEFECGVVPTKNTSWGAVKAIYR